MFTKRTLGILVPEELEGYEEILEDTKIAILKFRKNYGTGNLPKLKLYSMLSGNDIPGGIISKKGLISGYGDIKRVSGQIEILEHQMTSIQYAKLQRKVKEVLDDYEEIINMILMSFLNQ